MSEMTLRDICAIIPSLNPDEKLIQLIHTLQNAGFGEIILINDGSSEEYENFYNKARALDCTVINHGVNLGKGRALKSAMNYVLTQKNSVFGAVTVDSDGQHSIEDTVKCARALISHPHALILGCRDFTKENVPKASRFGNKLTRTLTKFLCGISVTDTQTGLRAFSVETMKKFVKIPGERYEYEMNMLIDTKKYSIPIVEESISTIYIENNHSSHFRKFKDSLRIYRIFFKFILSSFSSFLVDIGLFAFFTPLLERNFPNGYILISTVFARFLSSAFNYLLNKNIVFENKANTKTTIVKYYTLCILQTLLSAFSVSIIHRIFPAGIGETLIKIFVDSVLFLISYQLQREWVFKSCDSTTNNNIEN